MRLGNPGKLHSLRRCWFAASVLTIVILLASCGTKTSPQVSPVVPASAPMTVSGATISTKLPPVLFVMLDWMNGDWGNANYRFSYVDANGYRQEYTGHPELGALGGWREFHWCDLNPGLGVYDWTESDKYIQDAQAMQVTLPDGSVTAKPVGIAVVVWTADTLGGHIGVNYIPTWITSLGGGNTFSCYDPDDTGPCMPFCTPKYTNTAWQSYFDQFLMAMGQHYDNNPDFANLAWVAVGTGVDEEVVERKNLNGCAYAAGDTLAFTNWCSHVFDTYGRAFPNTPHFIQPTVHSAHIFASQATGNVSKMSGVKVNGLEPDVASAELRFNGVLTGGVTGFSELYHEQIPTGYEPKRGNGIEGNYWFFMQGLSTHPYMFDIQLPNLSDTYLAEQRTGFPILDFVRRHLGKSLQDTPDVWIVLRDTGWRDTTYTGSDGITRTYGPHHGDFSYWLYRSDTAPGSCSVVLQAEKLVAELPAAAKSHIYGWASTRRTDQATGNPYLSFDIDDGYRYAGQVPKAAGGQVSWQITMTLVNNSTDTFSLEYMDYYGNLVQRTATKGSALGTVDNWVDYTWTVTDAYFNNGLPGGMDFRINCNNDGNEIVHRLIARADGPPPPTPTPTLTRPPTSTPTRTPIPTQTCTPTRTPTGTITPPTPTNTVVLPTRTPTRTLTPTTGPSRTPTNTPTQGPSPTPTVPPTPFPGGHNLVALQQSLLGYLGTTDTYVSSYTPAGNYGLQANLVVKNDSVYEGLLRFDLGSVPSGTTINQATLRLYAYNRDKTGAMDVQIYGLLRAWVDTQATWNVAALNTPWGSSGANDVTTDRATQPSAVQNVSALSTWYEFDVTSLVRTWVADPQANYGVVLRGQGDLSLMYHFASSNHPTISFRPQLVLDYTAPEGTTPAQTPLATSSPTQTSWPSATSVASPTPSATASTTPQVSPSATRSPTPTASLTSQPTATLVPAPVEPVADLERRVGVLEQVVRMIIDILQRAGRLGR